MQLSRGKIGLSETTLRIWIFLNFFLNFHLIPLAFFSFLYKDYLLLQFWRMEDVNVTKQKEKTISYLSIVQMQFNQNLPWNHHIEHICRKINKNLGLLRSIKAFLTLSARLTSFTGFSLPHF